MRPDGPGFREVSFTYYALKLLEITFIIFETNSNEERFHAIYNLIDNVILLTVNI